MLLEPLVPAALSPFSASVLAEVTGRAWYNHYDRLAFGPQPRPAVVRIHAGYPYVNLSMGAALEAGQAGIEPPSLTVNGAVHPLASFEKPSFLAQFKTGRNARRIAETLAAYATDVDEITERSKTWYEKVRGLRWSQAEILQIMEEIVRTNAIPMALFWAARWQAEREREQLAALLSTGHQAALEQLMTATEQSAEAGFLTELRAAAAPLGDWAALASSLATAGDWERILTGEQLGAMRSLLTRFGHQHLTAAGEMDRPRWSEQPELLLEACAGATTAQTALPALRSSDPRRQKEVDGLAAALASAQRLQNKAGHALAYTLAATRRWALAAGHEAMADKRLLVASDAFLYELEELKEMMTGEWNVSDRDEIQAVAAQRRTQLATVRRQPLPGQLLIGDSEAVRV